MIKTLKIQALMVFTFSIAPFVGLSQTMEKEQYQNLSPERSHELKSEGGLEDKVLPVPESNPHCDDECLSQAKVCLTYKSKHPCHDLCGKVHSNGGGFVASTARVAPTAYVGPQAKVCVLIKPQFPHCSSLQPM